MSLAKTYVENFFERLGYEVELSERSRKTMDALRSQFNRYKRLLKKAKLYEPTDDAHIITIVMCEEIRMRAFLDVNEKGTLMDVDKEKKVKQKNHSISTFYQMSKMINDTSKKLGLSALDRKELAIEREEDDGMKDNDKEPKS